MEQAQLSGSDLIEKVTCNQNTGPLGPGYGTGTGTAEPGLPGKEAFQKTLIWYVHPTSATPEVNWNKNTGIPRIRKRGLMIVNVIKANGSR